MSEPLVTAREVAEHLGLAPKTILDMWRCKELPGFKIREGNGPVRFRLSEVDAWLDERRGAA